MEKYQESTTPNANTERKLETIKFYLLNEMFRNNRFILWDNLSGSLTFSEYLQKFSQLKNSNTLGDMLVCVSSLYTLPGKSIEIPTISKETIQNILESLVSGENNKAESIPTPIITDREQSSNPQEQVGITTLTEDMVDSCVNEIFSEYGWGAQKDINVRRFGYIKKLLQGQYDGSPIPQGPIPTKFLRWLQRYIMESNTLIEINDDRKQLIRQTIKVWLDTEQSEIQNISTFSPTKTNDIVQYLSDHGKSIDGKSQSIRKGVIQSLLKNGAKDYMQQILGVDRLTLIKNYINNNDLIAIDDHHKQVILTSIDNIINSKKPSKTIKHTITKQSNTNNKIIKQDASDISTKKQPKHETQVNISLEGFNIEGGGIIEDILEEVELSQPTKKSTIEGVAWVDTMKQINFNYDELKKFVKEKLGITFSQTACANVYNQVRKGETIGNDHKSYLYCIISYLKQLGKLDEVDDHDTYQRSLAGHIRPYQTSLTGYVLPESHQQNGILPQTETISLLKWEQDRALQSITGQETIDQMVLRFVQKYDKLSREQRAKCYQFPKKLRRLMELVEEGKTSFRSTLFVNQLSGFNDLVKLVLIIIQNYCRDKGGNTEYTHEIKPAIARQIKTKLLKIKEVETQATYESFVWNQK